VTEIDGLNIYFIHVRSKRDDALPLIVTHGWPRGHPASLQRSATSHASRPSMSVGDPTFVPAVHNGVT